MPNNAVLITLLDQLASTERPVLIGWRAVQQWPEGALKRLLEVGLLVKAARAESIECSECGRNVCYMDILSGSSDRAFVVCNDAEMHDEMGRINIPVEHLTQWKTSAKLLAKVIAQMLELDYQPDRKKLPANIKLGMLPSKQGRRYVSLNVQSLQLEVNQRNAPIEEILYFEGEELLLDRPRINQMLLAAPLQQGKPYTPSTSNREAGKRKTEAMHQDWRDAYLRLKRQYPKQSDTWISQQIAKLPISKGKVATTIYRRMKT